MASVLVLACTREAFAAEDPAVSGGARPTAAAAQKPPLAMSADGVETNCWLQLPSISKTAWREGEEPATVSPGEALHGTVVVTYTNRLEAAAATDEMPTTRGQYAVLFTVPATADYEGLERTNTFTIAASPDVWNGAGYSSPYDYAGSVAFTLDGYKDKTVENFPIRIKIANDSPKGFRYNALKNGTDDLRFFDTTGRCLPYEIETWNPSGESYFWLLVPALREGASFTMCWNLRDGCTLPENRPEDVWAAFEGVWHMDEEVDEAGALAQTRAADATGLGRDLIPRVGPEGVFSTQTSVEGVFGNARVNDTAARNKKQGSFFEMAGTEDLVLDGVFTLSFWIKFDAYANYPHLAARRSSAKGNVGFQIDLNVTDRKQLVARGDTQTGGYNTIVDDEFKNLGFTHLAFVYNGTNVSIYANGVCKVDRMTIGKASDNGLPIVIGNKCDGKEQSVWGKYDEVRLTKGVRGADWFGAETYLGTNANFYTAGTVANDPDAVLKNSWKTEPALRKTTWEFGTSDPYPTAADFNFATNAAHGVAVVTFYDRTTGQSLGTEVPKQVGEYRAFVTVEEEEDEQGTVWGKLEKTLEFRIVEKKSTHDYGITFDRILLMNDDFSVDGTQVEYQCYDAEYGYSDLYWRHLDGNDDDASTTPEDPAYVDDWSVSLKYNLGGGTHHLYMYRNSRLWDLYGVRVGNTFRNGADGPEYGAEGLQANQNYLPWNYESQRVIGETDREVDGWHRYAGHIVMQNVLGAAVTSSCYSNGIGTVYFDAVNGWTDNLFTDDDGDSRALEGTPNYRLEVQVATNRLDSTLPPYDDAVDSTYYKDVGGKRVLTLYRAAAYADWKTVPMQVLRFDNGSCTNLGSRTSLTLDIADGGTTGRFYRVIVPVNVTSPARFRIVRTAIQPDYAWNPDCDAYILMDNVICSKPSPVVRLEPYGRFVASKTGKAVLGREGAFDPPFPSVNDAAVYARAKAVLSTGEPVSPGNIAAAAMHYRWHYIEQKTTDWKVADLSPTTLRAMRPLELPAFEGDVEFWFDVNQNCSFYSYADYSGTGLYLGDSGYTEEVSSVTNKPASEKWFVRMREGKSDYAEVKLLVKASEKAPVAEFDLTVASDSIWRGYYRMTNVLENGILWRIEARDLQEPGATAWSSNTNRWYVADWDQSHATLPTFPAAGRLSAGGTNSWSRMPCDMQTGYLMFQVDESSLGVTVIRSDYQNFNSWTDAANGYFCGAFSDPEAKHGASVDTRQYGLSYAAWPDTPATNALWSLTFDDGTIDDPDYPGYKTFTGQEATYLERFEGWYVGKGMWVYGKYREPQSHVALQMAGCGEGYAEFSKYDVVIKADEWPRGLESVSFDARIAQPISPEYATFYDLGQKMTNYTFMTRACFDMRDNQGFSGNAALSLFAYYRARKGTYEARWEQIKGKLETTKPYAGRVLAPEPTGQRLVISRWDASGNTFKETELIAVTNTGTWNIQMPTMPSSSSTNNLLPFCVSVYTNGSATYVVAGVRVKAQKPTTSIPYTGVTPTETIPLPTILDSSKESAWYFVTCKDTSSKRLTSGSYGVLSSNCEGMFVNPEIREQPSWPGDVDSPEKVTTKKYASKQSLVTAERKPAYASCFPDIEDGWWAVNPGRTEAFGDATVYGFAHVAPSQTVDVYTAKKKSGDSWEEWSLLGQVQLTGFGEPGPDPDYRPLFYYTSDCKLQLRTGGGLDDYRTDVVIDDIEIRQWRGYRNKTAAAESAEGYTNFVFTCGWVTNGAVQLSARRTEVGTPCSIRSPLMDGYSGRGIGLGSFGFTYREPLRNIRLKVQIATNVTYRTVDALTESVSEDATGNENWLTVTNLTYAQLWTERPLNEDGVTKTWEISFGYHGAKGVMRVVVDPQLVEDVVGQMDTSLFGAIDVVQVVCSDEPSIDKHCWWGWNIQTIGDASDTQKRMYLPDYPITGDLTLRGRSLALNNSVTADVDPKEKRSDVVKHMPFLQSPTFTNAVIGQVTFKARKYELSDRAPAAKVVVYGADSMNVDDFSHDDEWKLVEEFPITNTLYTTYTCKTDAEKYYALRLAVVNVDGTLYPPPGSTGGDPAQRVMIDEVSVSEAVRAMLAFRNVGAFRSDLDGNAYVPGVTTKDEQPLCDENWGVQAEVFATMLGNEIDKSFTPRVKLHWYVGTDLWGYEKWKDRETGSAYLAQTVGSNYVYRSSYKEAPDAVMPAQSTPGTVVQYMLEVEYRTINTKQGVTTYPKATNWLDAVAWSTPDWYAPIDYNADPAYGAGKTFAAYTILDTVAPGWAWINEMNVFGVKLSTGGNSDEQFQYVEVCAPAEANLTGWRLRMLEVGIYNDSVNTNNIARFGAGTLSGTKKDNLGMASNKVFRCVGNKRSAQLKYDNGTLDGIWSFPDEALSSTFRYRDGVYCIYDTQMPFGMQLVRPSGIIESSALFVGTNRWGRLPGYRAYDPTNIVARLNKLVPGSKFFYAAEDCCGTFHSASVTSGHGEAAEFWANDWACSPGYINTNFSGKVQQIDPDHPTPHGDMVIVYASVDTAFGHITQRIGDRGVATNGAQLIMLRRGSETGTNIYYAVEPWYELKAVTTNGVDEWRYLPSVRAHVATVGRFASNNVTVVAGAQVDSKLREYGLTADNPYTPAVMDWLVKGRTLNPWQSEAERQFKNPGTIALADYLNMTNGVCGQLPLTTMYWLDMDPTASNLAFKAGMLKTWPETDNALGHPVGGYLGQNVLTNQKMRVFMMITNRADGTVWTPYILRGLDPNYTSWDYDPSGVYAQTWTSETFKVTGILANGLTSEKNSKHWIPLRWFVFHADSFFQPDNAEGHEPFTTDIEIVDPHSISSPGANAGWYQWCKENRWVPVFNRWAIDERLQQSAPEVLQPENFYAD